MLQVDRSDSSKVTIDAWEEPFIGNSHDVLLKRIRRGTFGSSISIVQSSGMGKSRCVDELSKTQFVVPMNLRNPQGEGFPPSDQNLYQFLTTVPESKLAAQARALTFLVSLFENVIATVAHLKGENPGSDVATLFRDFMTRGQTFRDQGRDRKDFYEKVVRRAKELLDMQTLVSGLGFTQWCTFLMDNATRAVQEVSCDPGVASAEPSFNSRPIIILAFDEAHTLDVVRTVPHGENLWTMGTELHQVLCTCPGQSIFSLFLSTAAKITSFAAPSWQRQYLVPPFTELGFDQSAPKINANEIWTLDKVVTDEHMARLGRPLFSTRHAATCRDPRLTLVQIFTVEFAMQKLMCRTIYAGDRLEDREALACLSRRLPLEFQTTRYPTSDEEWAQVEKHMRVCLSASGDLQDTTTVNPSEPLVSEAAFRVMDHEGFNAAMALRDVLSGFAVHQGERGELIALLLVTLARDQVVHNAVARGRDRQRSRVVPVTKFLQCLFRSGPGHDILSSLPSVVKEDSEDATIELSDMFAGAMLHFNHFVKISEHDMLDREYLWRLMSRGAAVLCAPNEKGIDALCQFTYHSRKLRKENLGVILFQFTNDACYGSTIKSELYPLMDPFTLGIFDDPDTTVPIIRIVLALAGKTPSLQTIERVPGETGKFTSYDIWCSGLDTKFYAPIRADGESLDAWGSLLKASQGGRDIYFEGDEASQQLRMSTNPGAATDPRFFQEWAPLE